MIPATNKAGVEGVSTQGQRRRVGLNNATPESNFLDHPPIWTNGTSTPAPPLAFPTQNSGAGHKEKQSLMPHGGQEAHKYSCTAPSPPPSFYPLQDSGQEGVEVGSIWWCAEAPYVGGDRQQYCF
eukprot:TRINITY_DN65303_c0_g1_i1.p1 TRINITY_DN65303_c0_g1~~TRINITY_DN65303_c0_g1_i1.p1  ORF type:complete len:125 (-),score=1.10 TRINITY_DN65303_c0_g1_i1:634-1008(-)